jgi:hypothetical protein
MPLLGSNINSELFMSNPIANNSAKSTPEPKYIIKGEKDSTIKFTDADKKLAVNLENFKNSLKELCIFHNTLIQELPQHYSKIFSNIIQTLLLARSSPPVHSKLLEIIETNFDQNSQSGIGCVGSYFKKPYNENYFPNSVTSMFITKTLNYRSLMLDCKTRLLYSLTDNESNDKLAHIYIHGDNLNYSDIINQLISNGISSIIIFSNYDITTNTFGTISNQINLEEYAASSNISSNISSKSSSKSSSNISSKSSSNSSSNSSSGLAFFIILLIIIVLALAIIKKY